MGWVEFSGEHGLSNDQGPGAVRKVRERRPMGAKEVALQIAQAGLDKKALQVEIIDVQGKIDYADYLVVMGGTSDRQVNALARSIEAALLDHGQRCAGVEGLPQGTWVLMDFGDVVVHIFHQDVRGYYDLESLWFDAARVQPPTQ